MSKIKNQGDAFISENDYLEGGIEYWNKQMTYYDFSLKKADVLDKLGLARSFKGEY